MCEILVFSLLKRLHPMLINPRCLDFSLRLVRAVKISLKDSDNICMFRSNKMLFVTSSFVGWLTLKVIWVRRHIEERTLILAQESNYTELDEIFALTMVYRSKMWVISFEEKRERPLNSSHLVICQALYEDVSLHRSYCSFPN